MKLVISLIGFSALAALAGCNDEEQVVVVPASVTPDMAEAPAPTPAPVAQDMAMAPTPTPVAPDMAMAPAPTFPMTASVSVGPNGTLTYVPQSVDIAAGGTVTWTWATTLAHSVTSDTGVFDSGIMTGGSFSFTFPSAGNFPYHCVVHGFIMSGMVMVH